MFPRARGLGKGSVAPGRLLPPYLPAGPRTSLWTSLPRCERTDSCWSSNQTAGMVHLQGASAPASTSNSAR